MGCAWRSARIDAVVRGHSGVATKLQRSLDDEGKADKALTRLSSRLNPKGLEMAVSARD